MSKKWDFSGWATRANLRCSDGRTIRKGAFKDCDGKTVPLVWNHRHDDPSEVLGHALLKDKGGDMYAYGSFNNTKKGLDAKELVNHGDVVALSIYANQLTQSSKIPPCDVIHGCIREVSLVLAGANPGAFIDNVLAHGELVEDEAVIFNGEEGGLILYHSKKDEEEEIEVEDEEEETEEEPEEADEEEVDEEESEEDQLKKSKKKKVKKEDLIHSDLEAELMSKVWGVDSLSHSDDETIQDIFNTFSEEQKKAVYAVIGLSLSKAKVGDTKSTLKHADDEDNSEGATISEIFDSMTEKQKKVAYAIIGAALESKEEKDNSEEEEDTTMKHNVFDSHDNENATLSHADMEQIFKDAKRLGSLKAAVEEAVEDGVLSHAVYDDATPPNEVTYGIANIDYLFPDARTINNTPEFIQREMGWVDKVMNATHHTPFARVKSMFADITMDEARAKGYTKGNVKAEEVFKLLKRATDPQTIYKKQKLDRDDILDITDFDVVAWLKAEMRMMLNEEVARAILIGDGRSGASNDKISEDHIRPVYNDADLYTVKVPVASAANATSAQKAKAFIDAVIRSRKNYKGSGNPTLFTTEDQLTEMLLIEDQLGHKLYKTESELATALRVKEIVTVEPMENMQIGITISGTTTQHNFIGVIVNLKDYNVGTNKGGQVSFFDDFDIDYNQQKYLLETRLSGALIKPYSALSFYETTAE